MSLGNTFETDILGLIFNATPIGNLADDASSAPATNLYAGLHTSDPGEAGDQTTNEAAYGSYARVAVARTTGGWTVTDDSISPVAAIEFPIASSGSETITHFSIGLDASGSGKLLLSGTVTPNIVVTSSVQPILTTATAITIN